MEEGRQPKWKIIYIIENGENFRRAQNCFDIFGKKDKDFQGRHPLWKTNCMEDSLNQR